MVVDPDDHREDVVRRLLARGVSPTTLRALLPTWDGMIASVAGHADAAAGATVHGPTGTETTSAADAEPDTTA
jgi:hypothetical protein